MKIDSSEAERLVFKTNSLSWTLFYSHFQFTILQSSNSSHLDTNLGDTSTARKVMGNESHYPSSVLNR